MSTFYQNLSPKSQQRWNCNIDLSQVETIDIQTNQTKKVTINPLQSQYVRGTRGCGKTTLAIQIAKFWIEATTPLLGEEDANYYCQFIEFAQLLELFERKYTKDPVSAKSVEQTIEKLTSAKLLVIDDFGSGKLTEFKAEELKKLINYRYENELQTVITSNYDRKTLLAQENGGAYENICSRLIEMCTVENFHLLPEKDWRIEVRVPSSFNAPVKTNHREPEIKPQRTDCPKVITIKITDFESLKGKIGLSKRKIDGYLSVYQGQNYQIDFDFDFNSFYSQLPEALYQV